MRSRGGHSGGGTKPHANHTSMVEATVSTPNSSSTFADTDVFSKEQVDALRRLMSRLETSITTSSSFAYTGNLAIALNASSTHFDNP
jgi:hypothetical protein